MDELVHKVKYFTIPMFSVIQIILSSDISFQTKAALDALDSPQLGKEANAWLVEFESTAAAWDVANRLLLEPIGSSKRFHGANIFYNKIRHDFHQIGSGLVFSNYIDNQLL